MKITVKNIKGEQFQVELAPENKVADLKQRIKDAKNVEPDLQKLVFKGSPIQDDNKSLQEYGMKDGDFLIMIVQKKPAVSNNNTQMQVEQQQPEKKKEEVEKPKSPIQKPKQPVQQTGEQYSASVEMIVTMGFNDRDQIVKALKASYGNVDRAVEFLISGNIPQEQQQQAPLAYDQEDDNENVLQLNEQMRSQLRTIIQQDPNQLNSILTNLAQTNPQLFNLINQNKEAFLQYIMQDDQDPDSNQYEDVDQLGEEDQQGIALTEQERKDIDEIVQLGFEGNDAAQAYLVFNKNKDQAVNYLLEQRMNGDLDAQGGEDPMLSQQMKLMQETILQQIQQQNQQKNQNQAQQQNQPPQQNQAQQQNNNQNQQQQQPEKKPNEKDQQQGGSGGGNNKKNDDDDNIFS